MRAIRRRMAEDGCRETGVLLGKLENVHNRAIEDHHYVAAARTVGRPPNHVQRYYASFSYQAGSWGRKRRVVAKVEWHSGELVPRVGLDRFHRSSVTNLSRPAERVVAFYNQRGKAEQ